MTNNQWLRARLLRDVTDQVASPMLLRASERDREFERLCSNRKVMGALRYGLFGAPDKLEYDRVTAMISRLHSYKHDRNAEWLIDVANLAELEFVEGRHNGVIPQDDGEHVAVV